MEREAKFQRQIDEVLDDTSVETNIIPLESLKYFIVRSFSGRLRLAIAEDLPEKERYSIRLQAVAHVILGHLDRPLASVIMQRKSSPYKPLTEEESLWNDHAKDLAQAMVSGTVDKLWERPDFQILYRSKRAEAQIVSDQIRNKT